VTTHTKISYIKSGLRLAGYGVLWALYPELALVSLLLIAAEILGIVEEIGAKYQ